MTCLGQLDKALAEIRRAQELDPLSLIINSNIGYTFTLLGRYDEAIAQFHKTLDLDPNFYYARYNLGLALELKGSTPEAIGEFQKAAALSEDLASLGFLGHLYGKIGRRAEAQQILNRLLEIRKQRYTEAYFIGLVYLGLGDRDEALRYFQESYEDRDGYNIGPIRVDPLLNELHGDARFEALAERSFQPVAARWRLNMRDKASFFSELKRRNVVPAGLTIADLKLNPPWDPLSNDPRFQKFCASQ